MNSEANVSSLADEVAATDPARLAAPSGGGGGGSGSTANWQSAHPLKQHLDRLVKAPSTARISMAVGELATAVDHAADDRAVAVAVSAIKVHHHSGLTAVTLAGLWAKWGRTTCLIDLGSGSKLLTGALSSSRPDLGGACQQAKAGTLNGLASLHSQLDGSAVIATGSADVLGLISTGDLTTLVTSLKQKYERIVILTPPIETSFPFLALYRSCDRLVLSLRRGKTRGGPVREIAEQAMVLGMRPLDAIWFE